MVDEVAWGIGWGSAADDVSPPPETAASHGASRSSSRSRVKVRQDTAAIVDESRSVSRAARSSSRSTSAVRTASRSKSRPSHHPYDDGQHHHHHHHHHHPLLHVGSTSAHPPRTQPSLSSLTNAILRTSSAMSSSDSSSPHTSAIILQPSLSSDSDVTHEYEHEHERGRLPRPRIHADASLSRSRSPHEMPVTPRDMSMDVGVRRRKSPPSRPKLGTSELGPSPSDLDTLDEDTRWQFSPSMDSESVAARSLSRFRHDDSSGSRSSSARGRASSRSHDELRKVVRNESMPPVLSPSHSSAWALPPLDKEYASGRTTGIVAPATPIPIPGASKSVRSQSLGPAYTSRHAK